MRRRVLRAVLLLLIAALLCFTFKLSAEPAQSSDATSGGFIARLLTIFDPSFSSLPDDLQQTRVAALQRLVRTLAHFAEYAVLGMLTGGFACTFSPRLRCQGFAAAFCALYAVSDEVHQAFVPGRACQASDVLVDTLGALLGAAVIYLLVRMLQRKEVSHGNH